MRSSFLAVGLVLALAGGCTGAPLRDVSPGSRQPTGSVAASPSPSASSASHPQRWTGTIVSRTYHDLYVGGRCATDWRTTLMLREHEGVVRGRGTAVRTSTGDPCPFPVAQLQIRTFRLRVFGKLGGGRLDVRLEATSFVPSTGADDLGGFRATTLGTVLHLRVRDGAVSQRVGLQAPDQDRGSFVSENTVRLRCPSC